MLTKDELNAMNVGQIVVETDGREWTKRPMGTWGSEGSVWGSSSLSELGVRRKEIHVEQSMPTASTGISMHALARDEIRKRQKIGLDRYGQPLQAMNGRDAVRDTIEELADGLAYALQIREERRMLREELQLLADEGDWAEGMAAELRRIINRYFPQENS